MMIHDILLFLFGVPLKSFYRKQEGVSSRKTTYYRNVKGINGYTLAVIGVVEDHQKGTIHFHLLVYAGLSAYVLQRFAFLGEVSSAIAEVLDSQYQSALPREVHIAHCIREVLQREANVEGSSMQDGPSPLSDETKESIFGHAEFLLQRKFDASIRNFDGK